MKEIKIEGIAKIACYRSRNNEYGNVKLNGVGLEDFLAEHLIEKPNTELPAELPAKSVALCRVTIVIEPSPVIITVNGQEMPLEL